MTSRSGWWLLVSNNKRTSYVSDLPGDGGKDWGYTSDSIQARHCTDRDKQRFISDMRLCGLTATCVWIQEIS